MGQLLPIWPVLPDDPSRCSSTVRILVKKCPSGQTTTLGPIKQETVRMQQVIQKCPFLEPIWQLVEESLLLCQSHVLFNSNKIQNNNGRWHKLDFPSWSEVSHAVDLVGSCLNCLSSWPLQENHFLNEVIFMPQHQYVRGLLDSARKKIMDDKQVFHLEILQNIILKVFPYLADGSVSDLLRSCPRAQILQIMMIIEASQWSDRFSIRSLSPCPMVLALQWLTNNLTRW
jgi:hypothetical protein